MTGQRLPEEEGNMVDGVPWQRVINGRGCISPREAGPLASARQVERLRAEGVTVEEFGMERRVDMVQYGWEGPL